MRILLPAALALLVWPVAPAGANGAGRCIAFVERAPRIFPAAFDPAQGKALAEIYGPGTNIPEAAWEGLELMRKVRVAA